MTYQVYSLMDKQAQLFAQPFISINENTCKRDVSMQIARSSGTLNFSPADYDLYRLGKFTDNSGVIESEAPFEFICNCANLAGE